VADALIRVEDTDTTVVVASVFDRERLPSVRSALGAVTDSTDSSASDPSDRAGGPEGNGSRLEGVDELAARQSGVEAVVDRAEAAGFDCVVRGFEHDGDPATALVDAVETTDADRLYVYGRRRSPVGKAVFGSTLQAVLADAPVPVVVVPSAVW
jgi:nucleotide-binding universal stress UspA family protein